MFNKHLIRQVEGVFIVMTLEILKGSIRYATKNKTFFILTLIIISLLEYSLDFGKGYILYSTIIYLFVLIGYGLKVTKDVINGGDCLPTITLKELFNFGFKGSIIYVFYIGIQYILITIICEIFKFPDFEIEELIVEFHETIHMFLTHDIVSFILFIVFGVLIVYATMFFTKIALGTLADGGSIKDAFNFSRIKRILDIIGLKEYVIDYSKIILSIVILMFVNKIFDSMGILSVIVGIVANFLIFIIEFRGVGLIYREYLELKSGKT